MNALENNRGAVIIYVTVFLALMTLLIGLAIDVGWMAYVRTQSQAAVDAAALSGAAAIPDYNKDGTTDQIDAMVKAPSNSKPCPPNSPPDAVCYNTVITESAGLNGSNAAVVVYNSTTDSITTPATPAAANGVTVGKSFSLPLFFARLLNGGEPTAPINVSATAVIRMRPSLPVDLVCNPNNSACPPPPGSQLKLALGQNPSPLDNSSFTSYYIPNASADELKNLVQNPGSIPCLTMGDPIELANGQDNSVMEEIKKAFDKKKYDHDNNPATPPAWPVIIPVISTNFNPNQTSPITGFVWFSIIEVAHTGNPKTITGIFGGGNPTLGWCPPHLRR